MIEIILNGEKKTLVCSQSLGSLLEAWGYKCDAIATALNETFIPRDKYNVTHIQDGDSIEIVGAMQGG